MCLFRNYVWRNEFFDDSLLAVFWPFDCIGGRGSLVSVFFVNSDLLISGFGFDSFRRPRGFKVILLMPQQELTYGSKRSKDKAMT